MIFVSHRDQGRKLVMFDPVHMFTMSNLKRALPPRTARSHTFTIAVGYSSLMVRLMEPKSENKELIKNRFLVLVAGCWVRVEHTRKRSSARVLKQCRLHMLHLDLSCK